MKEYIFTFGHGQVHQGKFVAIQAEKEIDARREMHRRFGNKWSMCYEPTRKATGREQAGVSRWGLEELK